VGVCGPTQFTRLGWHLPPLTLVASRIPPPGPFPTKPTPQKPSPQANAFPSVPSSVSSTQVLRTVPNAGVASTFQPWDQVLATAFATLTTTRSVGGLGRIQFTQLVFQSRPTRAVSPTTSTTPECFLYKHLVMTTFLPAAFLIAKAFLTPILVLKTVVNAFVEMISPPLALLNAIPCATTTPLPFVVGPMLFQSIASEELHNGFFLYFSLKENSILPS